MIETLISGSGLGFVAGSSPGALQSYLANITLRGGWRDGMMVVITPVLSDLPIIVLSVLVLSQMPPAVTRLIQIGGGLFIFWIAFNLFRSLRGEVVLKVDEGDGESRTKILRRCITMNLLNPGPWIFWTTVNGPQLIDALNQSVLNGIAFLVGFYGAFMILLTALVIVFDRLRHLDPRVTRGLLYASLVILIVFGTRLIVQGIQG